MLCYFSPWIYPAGQHFPLLITQIPKFSYRWPTVPLFLSPSLSLSRFLFFRVHFINHWGLFALLLVTKKRECFRAIFLALMIHKQEDSHGDRDLAAHRRSPSLRGALPSMRATLCWESKGIFASTPQSPALSQCCYRLGRAHLTLLWRATFGFHTLRKKAQVCLKSDS